MGPVVRPGSLLACLDQHAAQSPSRLAAIEGERALSHAALQQLVDEAAAALLSAGVRQGDRVAFLGPPGLQFWISLLATWRVGAVWVGLNPLYTEPELAHVLKDASPVLLILEASIDPASREAASKALARIGGPLPVWTDPSSSGLVNALSRVAIPPGPADPTAAQLSSAGVCLIVYTSGTTGRPKGALITGAGLVENGWWIARRMDFLPGRTLANLPVNHIGCVGDVCATSLVQGSTLVFMRRFDPAASVRLIQDARITLLPQVPAQYQLMLRDGGLDQRALSGVRHLAWGGAAMPRALVAQFAQWVPDLFTSYGLTECSGTITVSPPGADLETLAGTVGLPVEGGRVRVVGTAGEAQATEVGGEIQIHGPHLFHGYLHQQDAKRAALTADGWLRTGDLGAFDTKGNLRLLGRLRDMFKSGGYNVYPREVEDVVEACPGVELCAVLGEPDPLWGEVGVAFVQAPLGAVSSDQLLAHCSRHLASYKRPKRFVVKASLPLLPIGKIDKQRLREQELPSAPS